MNVHAAVLLSLIALIAAVVNGALGYGFSSLTVPVALLTYTSRVLSPALVLIEMPLNWYTLYVNRKSLPGVWRRVLPIVVFLVPGVLAGSYLLSQAHPAIMKFIAYVILLPLILCQAAGIRKPIRSPGREKFCGGVLGAGIGALYATTTISGPPLAVMLNNQGLVKGEFRAAMGIVRTVESTLTAVSYLFLGLYTAASFQLIPFILPAVLIGLPLGVFIVRRMASETFRRICMSLDAWVVGFGISAVLISLNLVKGPYAYIPFAVSVAIDLSLLTMFFKKRLRSPVVVRV
jgi:uncharacterized membrane protein YfcA